MFELVHFRGADKIIKEKKMTNIVRSLMQYLDDCLYGTRHKSELMRQALKENDWRNNGDCKIFTERKYAYHGFRNRVAIDGSFSSYEAIQGALFRLQLGYDHKKIDVGIVMIPAQRSEKSKLGKTRDLVKKEIELLEPTITIPVLIAIFDLGRPGELYEENRQKPEKVIKKKDVDQEELARKYLHGDKQYESEPEIDDEVSAESRRRKPAVYKKTMINDQKIAA